MDCSLCPYSFTVNKWNNTCVRPGFVSKRGALDIQHETGAQGTAFSHWQRTVCDPYVHSSYDGTAYQLRYASNCLSCCSRHFRFFSGISCVKDLLMPLFARILVPSTAKISIQNSFISSRPFTKARNIFLHALCVFRQGDQVKSGIPNGFRAFSFGSAPTFGPVLISVLTY